MQLKRFNTIGPNELRVGDDVLFEEDVADKPRQMRGEISAIEGRRVVIRVKVIGYGNGLQGVASSDPPNVGDELVFDAVHVARCHRLEEAN